MADSSTRAEYIPILFTGGCWARCQLGNGIKYVPIPRIFMKLSLWLDEGVPGGAMSEVTPVFRYRSRIRNLNRKLFI